MELEIPPWSFRSVSLLSSQDLDKLAHETLEELIIRIKSRLATLQAKDEAFTTIISLKSMIFHFESEWFNHSRNPSYYTLYREIN